MKEGSNWPTPPEKTILNSPSRIRVNISTLQNIGLQAQGNPKILLQIQESLVEYFVSEVGSLSLKADYIRTTGN